MHKSFWKGKRVFITGHTGFKGSWLSLWLQSLGATVVGYSLEPPSVPSMYEAAQIGDNMESITRDVRDLQTLKGALGKHKPEVVFHLAAQSLVRKSYVDPVETFGTNVMGTVNILDSVRESESVKAVIVVTSDKCYENREWVWGYREHEAMGGHEPYSSSKGCAELVTAAYRHSFFSDETGASIASVRAGNVIGGGDWAADRLIPDIMRAIAKGETVLIRNPRAIRPWQHVLEPVRGYLMLAESLWEGSNCEGAWNFGPAEDDAREVSWIVRYISDRWGKDARWELDAADNPHEARYLKLDCSKARSELGWLPALRLPQALDWIIEWYREFMEGPDMRKASESEILRYEKMAGISS
jgi:CDP-glucose 4,6-dehydratase